MNKSSKGINQERRRRMESKFTGRVKQILFEMFFSFAEYRGESGGKKFFNLFLHFVQI